MTTSSKDALALSISQKLRQISANDLQALAEDMAVIACPQMFKAQPIYRQGRNINAQTTKNWPDAYVLTGTDRVNGIEATRDQQSWSKHLAADLTKASDPEHLQLSGYFFVAGYPDHQPQEAELREWKAKFMALGIPAGNVQLLVGKHLALELADPKYARIRQIYLGLAPSSEHFEEIRQCIVRRSMGEMGAPTEADLTNGLAFEPTVAGAVRKALFADSACVVRGHGASGKTTLSHWIGMAPEFVKTPVYKLDLAAWGDDHSIGKFCNEMTALSGQDVLFMIDNIHLYEGAARVLADHWRQYSKPLGTRMLLLGRHSRSGEELPGVSTKLVMRAGAAEMQGIVRYLTTKFGRSVSAVPKEQLEMWARTFGGKHKKSGIGVDLIAFCAAVNQRMRPLVNGDWRLSERDAATAVQDHYLQPIRGEQVRSNLLRLAALSELEFPIPATILPHPSAGFGECIDHGLVIARSGRFSLTHPALGRLLSAASGTNVSQERLAAGSRSAVLTAKMLAPGHNPAERPALLQQLGTALASGDWTESCNSLQDLVPLVSVSLRAKLASSKTMDAQICGNPRLYGHIEAARSVDTFVSVSGQLQFRGLTQSAAWLLDFSDPVVGRSLQDNLMRAPAAQALALLKNVPHPQVACASIDRERWDHSRQEVAVDVASVTSQLGRFLGRYEQADLAVAPTREFLKRFDAHSLARSDLGDISNIVRYAGANSEVLAPFFARLGELGWLSQAYEKTTSGQLCGALMSFANYLPLDVRPAILLPSIELRIATQSQQLCMHDPGSVARFVCMLGATSALWGLDFAPLAWRWPQQLTIAEVYSSRAPVNAHASELGMYELQFWLGLRWLWVHTDALPELNDPQLGEAFLRRLEASVAPTSESLAVSTQLLLWLKEQRASQWRFAPTPHVSGPQEASGLVNIV